MYWSAMRRDLEACHRSGEIDEGFIARFAKAEAEFKEYYEAFTDLRSWVQVSTFAEHGGDPARALQALGSAKRIFRPGGEWGDLWAVRGLKLELMDIYGAAPPPEEPGARDVEPPGK
jgi:hypothetical protein